MSSSFDPCGPARLPVADGSIHPDALGWPGVTALRSTLISVPVPTATEAVTAERIDATFLPDSQALTEKAAHGCRFRDFVVRPFTLVPRGGRPRLLFLNCPRYEVTEDDEAGSGLWRPLPNELAPHLDIECSLETLLIGLLGYHSVEECHRYTLAPRQTLEAIVQGLRPFQLEALASENVRPDGVTLVTLRVHGEPEDHFVVHVVALERNRGRCWTLAVVDRSLGLDGVVAEVMRAVATLPLRTRKTWLTAFGRDRNDWRVAAGVVELLGPNRPVHPECGVFDWTRDMQSHRGGILVQEVERLNQGLATLACQASLSVAELNQRALVRQGFCATALVPLERVRVRRDECYAASPRFEVSDPLWNTLPNPS